MFHRIDELGHGAPPIYDCNPEGEVWVLGPQGRPERMSTVGIRRFTVPIYPDIHVTEEEALEMLRQAVPNASWLITVRSPRGKGFCALLDEPSAAPNTPFGIGSALWPGLSKLVEEAGEVAQVVGKIIGAGGATIHFDGTSWRTRLEDEIADLMAACHFVIERNQLDATRITERTAKKLALFQQWHSKL